MDNVIDINKKEVEKPTYIIVVRIGHNGSEQRTSFGLLGQEVKGALEKLGLGYNDFGAYSDQEYENRNNPEWKKSYTMENKTVGLSYIGFIAPLIKAVQELSEEVTYLKSKLETA